MKQEVRAKKGQTRNCWHPANYYNDYNHSTTSTSTSIQTAGQQSSSSSICSKTDFGCWIQHVYFADPTKLGQLAVDLTTIIDLWLGLPVFAASDVAKVLGAQALGDLVLSIEDAVVYHNTGAFANAVAGFVAGAIGDIIANGISFSQSMMLVAAGITTVVGVAGFDEIKASVAMIVTTVDSAGFLADIGVEWTQYSQS